MVHRITMDSVESSQIHSIGYDPETNTLAIRFKSRGGPGSLYHYSNFTVDDFTAFSNAESKGAHFGKYIKPFSDRYPYVKIESAPAAAEVQA